MNKRVVLLAWLLALAACGQPAGAATPAGRTFLSTAVTEDGAPRPLVGTTRIELTFADDGSLRASAGCNQIGGAARLADGKLVIDEVATTEMGCDQARMDQDTWLGRFLGGRPAWRLSGDELVLTRGGVEIRFTDRKSADPDRPLLGTRWVVDTLIAGQTASSVPAGATAFLVFDGTGGVTGSAGCNRLSGRATVSGDTIVFARIATTRMACPGGADTLERAVLAVLGSPSVTYAIEARHLTLTGTQDRGLRFTA